MNNYLFEVTYWDGYVEVTKPITCYGWDNLLADFEVLVNGEQPAGSRVITLEDLVKIELISC